MRPILLVFLAVGAIGLAAIWSRPAQPTGNESAAAAPRASFTVVELFQSQGCSSCPPANTNLIKLVERNDVLALSFGVTYWDDLGWADTFASEANTDRQRAYARGLGRSNVATPQMVINGVHDIVGSRMESVQTTIERAGHAPGGIEVREGKVHLAARPELAGTADVWLVRFDPREHQVSIQRGENRGRTLPHRNTVRELVRLARWSGAEATIDLPAPTDPALGLAILVQQPGGPLLAAGRA